MSVRSWHWGKLAILWAWGAAFVVIGLEALRMSGERFVVGTLILAGMLVVLVLLSAITWQWLSGKEGGANNGSGGASKEGDET